MHYRMKYFTKETTNKILSTFPELIAQWTNDMNRLMMMRGSNGMPDPNAGPHVQQGMPPHGPGPGTQPGYVDQSLHLHYIPSPREVKGWEHEFNM
jgi:hypothetical protein